MYWLYSKQKKTKGSVRQWAVVWDGKNPHLLDQLLCSLRVVACWPCGQPGLALGGV